MLHLVGCTLRIVQRQYGVNCVAEHYIHKLSEFLDLHKHSVL